jgi:hypothetical protein
MAAKMAGNSPLFWRLLLRHLETLNDTDILGEANRDQYVKDKSTPTMSLLAPTSHSTPHARAFEGNLGAVLGATVLQCSPWGCVFGLRDVHGDWSFYLQENVALTYMQNGTTSVFQTCRPIFLSRIFPVVARANPVAIHDGTNVVVPNPFTPSLYVKKR